ncbi:MAG: cyclodeaminase/cyclohydrolase family protein [Oscillospiraceae bacterium]|nr:cyclodeaminase/cyclohydrolase family protein [Oscillospiraceae bacterium]
MSMLETSVSGFTEQLASKAPVPGGGGASALVGAVGIALGDMVGELTVGKKKYADVEDEIKALMERAQALRGKLLACIDKDAEAFAPLSRAYGIPRDDPSRDEIMEACLRDAAAAPLEIFELCCEAIDLQKAFAEKGSRLVVSDAATGVALCRAALQGAAVNVKVNTKLMKDRAYAGEINARIDALSGRYLRLADEVYDSVYGGF